MTKTYVGFRTMILRTITTVSFLFSLLLLIGFAALGANNDLPMLAQKRIFRTYAQGSIASTQEIAQRDYIVRDRQHLCLVDYGMNSSEYRYEVFLSNEEIVSGIKISYSGDAKSCDVRGTYFDASCQELWLEGGDLRCVKAGGHTSSIALAKRKGRPLPLIAHDDICKRVRKTVERYNVGGSDMTIKKQNGGCLVNASHQCSSLIVSAERTHLVCLGNRTETMLSWTGRVMNQFRPNDTEFAKARGEEMIHVHRTLASEKKRRLDLIKKEEMRKKAEEAEAEAAKKAAKSSGH